MFLSGSFEREKEVSMPADAKLRKLMPKNKRYKDRERDGLYAAVIPAATIALSVANLFWQEVLPGNCK